MDNQMALAGSAFATRQNYIRGIRALILHYQRVPEACSVDELKAFLVFQRDKCNFSSSTVNLRVCGLKYYFREVVYRPDLVVKIPNPRVQKYDTDILTIEEVHLLFQCCRDMRQVLLLHLLYDTGLRVREVIRLRPSDFDKHNRTIIIRKSKGDKTRTVFYGDKLRDSLNKYCEARGSLPTNTLLESYKEKGSPLTTNGVRYVI